MPKREIPCRIAVFRMFPYSKPSHQNAANTRNRQCLCGYLSLRDLASDDRRENNLRGDGDERAGFLLFRPELISGTAFLWVSHVPPLFISGTWDTKADAANWDVWDKNGTVVGHMGQLFITFCF